MTTVYEHGPGPLDRYGVYGFQVTCGCGSSTSGITVNHRSPPHFPRSRLACRAVRCSAIARLTSTPKVCISFSTSGVHGRP